MAAVTPSTDLYLLQCPIEIDNRNQINFTNATAQYNYFSGLNKLTVDNFSYQRKDSTIRFPAHIDDIRNFNYVMYRNDNYSNKWFYAFIENMEYLNDSTTLIKIKTDVFQTWQFDLTYKRSFVIREHVNNDAIGANTIPEGLETGEYLCQKTQMWEYNNRQYMICMQVTDLPGWDVDQFTLNVTKKNYNRIINGCWILGFTYNDAGVAGMNKTIKWYDTNMKGDSIIALYVVPKSIATWTDRDAYAVNGYHPFFPSDTNVATVMAVNTFSMDSSLNGYVPKNNKLYTKEFNYFTLSNCNGDVYTYNFEDFNGNPQFEADGALAQNAPIRAFPTNYKKCSSNPVSGWDFGVNAGKYPILSWVSDYYLNWQAQNGKYIEQQRELSTVKGAASIAGSLLSANPAGIAGGIASYASDLVNYAHQVEVAEKTPNTAKGCSNTGDLNFSFGGDRFIFRQMCVRQEYAKIIDGIFSAVGYKVNTYKIPNVTGRQNWNYVETSNCNILANIPQEDLDEIKGMFDSGVTIWHNTATFLDYSQNNPIV